MGFGNVNGCTSIYKWEQAHKHFTETPQPRGTDWDDNERPLDNARKHHYRLVRGENFYDVYLYSTPMARYHKPEGGTRVVEYNFDSRSKLYSSFMWRVTDTGRCKLFATTDGRKIYVPICKGGRYGFGTTLTLVNGMVDVSRSQHKPIGTYVMSDEKRAWRKQARVFMRPFFDLMAIRVPEIRAEVESRGLSKWRGRPGRGSASFCAADFQAYGIRNIPFEFTSANTELLSSMYEDKVEAVLEVAAYSSVEVTNEQIAKRAASNLLNDMSKIHPGKDVQLRPLPQFPEDLPARFVEA